MKFQLTAKTDCNAMSKFQSFSSLACDDFHFVADSNKTEFCNFVVFVVENLWDRKLAETSWRCFEKQEATRKRKPRGGYYTTGCGNTFYSVDCTFHFIFLFH